MPLNPFVDEELIKETKKIVKSNYKQDDILEEHQFIANCLKIGLKIEDLKQLSYKDVAKIMLCFADRENSKKTTATQSDWDMLAGRR